jgi:hypothetical protein
MPVLLVEVVVQVQVLRVREVKDLMVPLEEEHLVLGEVLFRLYQ